MYGKTEIYYMMRDKVIPSLLNSERNIKLEDIKEVFEKSSYWKSRNFNYSKNNYSSKNKHKLSLTYHHKKSKYKFFSSSKNKPTQINANNDNNNLADILQINSNSINSRNYLDHNLYQIEHNKYYLNFYPQNTYVAFRNPLLKSFSNHIYKLTQAQNNNTSQLKTERTIKINKPSKIRKAISAKNKKKLFLINYRNNTLKNKGDNFEYKTFHYFQKTKIKRLKLGDLSHKKDEINNHLVLRGLAMNNNQKKIYANCQFLNLDKENNKNNINNLENFFSPKDYIKRKKFKKYKKQNNLNINISYSLKGLLDFKYPININNNNFNSKKKRK